MLNFLANQFKKPDGIAGRIVAAIMARANLGYYKWIAQNIRFSKDDVVIEIGFGPGQGIEYLFAHAGFSRMHGVDFSGLMLKQASARNRKWIVSGNLTLFHGDLINFTPQGSYTKIIGINILYFWNDLDAYAKKLYECLKPGGTAILYFTAKEAMEKFALTKEDVFNKYSLEQLSAAFTSAGFAEVNFKEAGNIKRGYFLLAVR